MSIFTKEQMWKVAVNQIGAYCIGPNDFPSVILDDPEDVEGLYIALKKAHEEAVEFYERGIIG